LNVAPNGHGRLLVVDAVPARREHLARALPSLGYDAHVVGDARAAMAHLETRPADLLLLDVTLPADGTDALLAGRGGHAALRDVPVLILATPGDAGRVAECLALGADDYVSEPFFSPLLAARVASCLDRSRLRATGARHGRELARELDIGRDIQRGFLPAALPTWPGWDIAAAFEAARSVSGDFYDAFHFADGLMIGVVVGDVCGKGVGASLFMALFRSLIRALATQMVHSGLTRVGGGDDDRLFTALRVANDYIANVHGSANMFATAFAASIDPRSGTIRWVNAGHDAALLFGADGGVRARLEPTGPALGLFPGIALATQQVRLQAGETLLVTTDGVSEARDRTGAFFGDDRLVALGARPVESASALVERVTGAVHAFAGGAEPADDLTLVAVRRDARPDRG